MAYTSYDAPAEFFNMDPTTAGFAVASNQITIGCSDHATPANQFLTNLTGALAASSTVQVIFGLIDAIYTRLKAIKTLDSANAPTKWDITRNGAIDESTGEMVYRYSITIRVNAGSLVAVNS